jgi:hypothetical protein
LISSSSEDEQEKMSGRHNSKCKSTVQWFCKRTTFQWFCMPQGHCVHIELTTHFLFFFQASRLTLQIQGGTIRKGLW